MTLQLEKTEKNLEEVLIEKNRIKFDAFELQQRYNKITEIKTCDAGTNTVFFNDFIAFNIRRTFLLI